MKATELIQDLRVYVESAKTQDGAVPVAALEAYLAEMTRIADAQQELALEDRQRSAAGQQLELEYAVERARAAPESAELFKSAIEAGQAALVSAIVINGGAAVALLAFLGNLLTTQAEDVDPFPISGIGTALLVFLLGVGCAGFASGVRYLVQMAHALKWKRSAIALNIVSTGLGFASFAAFLLGGVWTYLAIV